MEVTALISLLQKSNIQMTIVPERNRVLVQLDSHVVKDLGLEFDATDLIESDILNAISQIKDKHP